MLVGFAVARFAAAAAARVLGSSSLPAVLLACLVYGSVQYTLTVMANIAWKDARVWYIAYVASLLSIASDSLIKIFNGAAFKVLSSVAKRAIGAITHTFNSLWAKSLNFFDILTTIPFMLVDLALA
jgi:hypothetical protein